MNAQRADLPSNYFFQPVIGGKVDTAAHKVIRVLSAIYNPGNQTVTLSPARRLNLHHIYQITASGQAPQGLTNQYGVLLDGTGHGLPGSNFVFKFAGLPSLANIPGPGQAHPIGTKQAAARSAAHPDAAGVERLMAHGGLTRTALAASRKVSLAPIKIDSPGVRRGFIDAHPASSFAS
jgi:hypothetical protein